MRNDSYSSISGEFVGRTGALRRIGIRAMSAFFVLIIATALVPQTAQATDSVSRPFGFTRIALNPGDSRACSTLFDPLNDASIQATLGQQLTASYTADTADRVLKWDPHTQTYVAALRYPSDSQSSLWIAGDGSSQDSSMTILPGDGFFIENRQEYSQTVFLSGLIPLAGAMDVAIHPGLNLFAYPFPAPIGLNHTALASAGAKANKRASSADQITDPDDGQMSWLKSHRKNPGTWMTGRKAKSSETLMPGAAHWYMSLGNNAFQWSPTRPYEAPFASNSSLVIDSVTIDDNNGATLGVSVERPGAELEIYYQDLARGGLFNPRSWKIAELNIALESGTPLQWTDVGSENRPPVADVITRLYLVAMSDVDSDGDGLPDGRETFIHNTSPSSEDTDADSMPDGWEIENQLNPLLADGGSDLDGDGVTNADEYLAGTDPNLSDAPPSEPPPSEPPPSEPPPSEPPPSEKLKGIRIDPGYFYGGSYSGQSTDAIAALMVDLALEWGANTIYFRAVSPYYGAFWNQPVTPDLYSEGGHGVNNIFPLVIQKAHAAGVTIIAYVEPNRMKSVWDANPDWREKDIQGNDYRPDSYPLSVFHPDYLAWTTSFVNELLDMGADGVDIAECDYVVWGDAATYDAAANARYFAEYPAGSLGDANWVALRKQVLTEWYEHIGTVTHAREREFHVTYTWVSHADGSLYNHADISQGTGFSFDDLLALPIASRPDVIVAELMWQQAAARHGEALFDAEWTESASKQFTTFVAGRAEAIVHVEVSPFIGAAGTIAPMPDEIETSVALALQHSDGADIYDMDQANNLLYDFNGSVDTWAAIAISNAFNATYP